MALEPSATGRALFSFVTAIPHCLLHIGRSGPSTAPGLREVLDFSDPNDPPIKGIVLVPFEVKP